jgi:hypothetical protein
MILVKIGYADKTSDFFTNVEDVKLDSESNTFVLIATDDSFIIQVPRENVRYIHTKKIEPEAPRETTIEENKDDRVQS